MTGSRSSSGGVDCTVSFPRTVGLPMTCQWARTVGALSRAWQPVFSIESWANVLINSGTNLILVYKCQVFTTLANSL